MVSKKRRRIKSKTPINWSYFSFKQRLLNKIREYPNVKVKIVI